MTSRKQRPAGSPPRKAGGSHSERETARAARKPAEPPVRKAGKSAAPRKPAESPVRKAGKTPAVRPRGAAARPAAPDRPAGGGKAGGKTVAFRKAAPEAPAPRRRPLTARQARILLNLEQALSQRIVGKDDAVARIARV